MQVVTRYISQIIIASLWALNEMASDRKEAIFLGKTGPAWPRAATQIPWLAELQG